MILHLPIRNDILFRDMVFKSHSATRADVVRDADTLKLKDTYEQFKPDYRADTIIQTG